MTYKILITTKRERFLLTDREFTGLEKAKSFVDRYNDQYQLAANAKVVVQDGKYLKYVY